MQALTGLPGDELRYSVGEGRAGVGSAHQLALGHLGVGLGKLQPQRLGDLRVEADALWKGTGQQRSVRLNLVVGCCPPFKKAIWAKTASDFVPISPRAAGVAVTSCAWQRAWPRGSHSSDILELSTIFGSRYPVQPRSQQGISGVLPQCKDGEEPGFPRRSPWDNRYWDPSLLVFPRGSQHSRSVHSWRPQLLSGCRSSRTPRAAERGGEGRSGPRPHHIPSSW